MAYYYALLYSSLSPANLFSASLSLSKNFFPCWLVCSSSLPPFSLAIWWNIKDSSETDSWKKSFGERRKRQGRNESVKWCEVRRKWNGIEYLSKYSSSLLHLQNLLRLPSRHNNISTEGAVGLCDEPSKLVHLFFSVLKLILSFPLCLFLCLSLRSYSFSTTLSLIHRPY